MTKTDPKPSGVWIAIDRTAAGFRVVGVFASFDLADTACKGLAHFEIANIEIGRSYRERMIDWRVIIGLKP